MLTGLQATFMLHIAEARQPEGVPVPYAHRWGTVAVQLETAGLIERHHVGTNKIGACFTPLGAKVFAAIAQAAK